ncbi:MAG TPA: DUF6036 family nucleotidyltransferase [Ignavibacteriaceae bacterium]|nr:DUF6036 family nucleotidyltransferase [Ignavibacteriaceae bacterium]
MSKIFLSSDIIEFLFLLNKYKVKYLIVGGEAVIYYGHARLTGDIDIFYKRGKENCLNLFKVLNEFWDADIPGVSKKEELQKKGEIFQFGVPPNRIDLINEIEKVQFDEAYENRIEDKIRHKRKSFNIFYIGLNDLIKNKRAVNRSKDKEDLKFLKQLIKNS